MTQSLSQPCEFYLPCRDADEQMRSCAALGAARVVFHRIEPGRSRLTRGPFAAPMVLTPIKSPGRRRSCRPGSYTSMLDGRHYPGAVRSSVLGIVICAARTARRRRARALQQALQLAPGWAAGVPTCIIMLATSAAHHARRRTSVMEVDNKADNK